MAGLSDLSLPRYPPRTTASDGEASGGSCGELRSGSPSRTVAALEGIWYNQCMTDVRMLVSWGPPAGAERDRFSNTLFFAVDGAGAPPDYEDLAQDLLVIYQNRSWCAGCKIEVRAYNMADAKPRPERAFKTSTMTGSYPNGPGQVALCLSYYSQRNLPRQRGRIYCGPFGQPSLRPSSPEIALLMTHAQDLAGLGGLNVDWSVYSPTKAALGEDPTMTISNYWVDNSWDIQRRRKLEATSRSAGSTSG